MKRPRHTRENEEKEDKIKKRRSHNHNETEDNIDRLSDLPDFILILILSFLKVEDAVRTCILSSRWQHLWKHLPSLTLHSSDFTTVKRFMNFVDGILHLRDFSTALDALDFKLGGVVEPHLLESIVSYAASHNINTLRLSFSLPCLFGHLRCSLSSLSSCCSLKSLDIGFDFPLQFPNSLNLPALTYLKLRNLYFFIGNNGRVEPFSTFNQLNSLILDKCFVQDAKTLCISSTTLINLSLRTTFDLDVELFAPSLCTFTFFCHPFQKLFGSHLSSIKQVSIEVYHVEESGTFHMLDWLIEMTNIKSLTVTPRTLKALSLFPDIFNLKLTSWCNLKSLKLKLDFDSVCNARSIELELASGKSWKENAKLRETVKAKLGSIYSSILDGMIEFLLQNSPSAKVDIMLCEEVRRLRFLVVDVIST